MTDQLRDELTDIRGVGDATADEILDVLADADTGPPDVSEELANALDYIQAGEHEYASKYVRRAAAKYGITD